MAGACLATPGWGLGQHAGEDPRLTDLEFVVSTIAEEHPDPYLLYGEKVWASRQASLRFRMAQLDDAEFALELQGIVALLGDANSELRPLEASGARLPLEFGWFPEGCFVVGARPGREDLLGQQLVAVDGQPVASLLDRLIPLTSADHAFAARALAVQRLNQPHLLYTAGLANQRDSLQLRLARAGGAVDEVLLQADPGSAPEDPDWVRLARPAAAGKTSAPEAAWRRLAPGLGYLDPGRGSADLDDLDEALRALGAEPEVPCLVVDLRGPVAGPGHTPKGFAADEWADKIRTSRWNVPGRLFVLTSLAMHPGAMDLAVGLDRQTSGLFVGAPTRWRPGRRIRVVERPLPNLPYVLRCATESGRSGDEVDPRSWIQPDLPAGLSYADLQAGKDPGLAAVVAYRLRGGPEDGKAPATAHTGHRARAAGSPVGPRHLRPGQAQALATRVDEVRVTPPKDVDLQVRAPGRETYLGRTIAQTMHWRGAEWLMRQTREDEEHATRMLDALGLQPGLILCDMGCGNGYHTLRMAQRVAPGGWIYAADIQDPMLAMLKRRQQRKGIDNVTLVHNSLEDPGLPDRSCDLILMVDVYHEFSHPVLMLAGMRRALKPGGKLVLVEFRAEDPEVPIKRLHKMSKAQITREMTANGFAACGEFDELPWQHVMMFTPSRDN
ncbi:MAG: class I SAM-dependent methyltransferase [Planctomycetota bacterium]|nr:class I SAM-dependent methyltransferase [Planctomycetota bacterium]